MGVHVVVEPGFYLLEVMDGVVEEGRKDGGGSPSCSVRLVVDVVASETALFVRYGGGHFAVSVYVRVCV